MPPTMIIIVLSVVSGSTGDSVKYGVSREAGLDRCMIYSHGTCYYDKSQCVM